MMTLEQIREKLKDRKLMAVSESTGLAYNTVWRVSAGKTTSVSYDVVKRLSDYLEGK
jgi:hypothetical protein